MKTLLRICLILGALFCFTIGYPTSARASCNGSSVTPSPHYGGGGGKPFTDIATPIQEVSGIKIRSGAEVDAIQICFRGQAMDFCANQHGGNGGTLFEFSLGPGEYISRIDGRSGSRIDRLTFITNTGKMFGPHGGNGGSPFSIPSICLNGIAGRSGNRLDAFQAFSGEAND
ncbi:MAG: jacalin-like lectin domain protein [Moorea sp. SIO3G5]|nr:jacalin-like lectin domain protein [Moorena sp. SIO3G5]